MTDDRRPTVTPPTVAIVKHGIGFDIVTVDDGSRIVTGIRCQACQRISFNANDVRERYCGACHVFYDATNPEP